MQEHFRKYLHSVTNPEEFEEITKFISNKANTEALYQIMEKEFHKSLDENIDFDKKGTQVFQNIKEKILNDEAKRAQRKIKLYSSSLRLAAVLVISLLISSIWLLLQNRKTQAPVYDQLQTINIPNGAKTQFLLPDGSSVWLNSGSKLTYSNNFSTKRQVFLNGEAFFDIKKSKIPFDVNTNYGKIEVLGTAFDVLAYPETTFATTLVRGSVHINENIYNQQQILLPGEQAKLIDGNLIKYKVDTELFTSWKDGKICFKREPFPSLMKRLERWFNVKIQYSPDQVKGLWYTGTIEMETITEVMDMVCSATPVQYKSNRRTRIITVFLRSK